MDTAFISQMQSLLGSEWEAFEAAMQQAPPLSIRVNPAKWSGPARQGGQEAEQSSAIQAHDGQVPWHPQGYYLAARPVFTLDPLWHAGAYYVQEASSMAIAEALRQTLNLDKPLLALDLAAAPGGKSTLIASMLLPGSLLIANEVIRSRYQALKQNLIRWGLPNAALSNHDPRDFTPLTGQFDLVLVDAPCSGEGLFRKDPGAQREWSPQQVQFCAARQRRILSDAVTLIAPGGVLLYSTCTYNEEENTANAHWLTDAAGLEYLPLNLPDPWGIVARHPGYQFYPHRVRGEGFYMACFRKAGNRIDAAGNTRQMAPGFKPAPDKTAAQLAPWLKDPAGLKILEDAHGALFALPASVTDAFFSAAAALHRIEPVLGIGMLKQGELVPAHALALSAALHPGISSVSLNLEQAIRYLRKEDPQLTGAQRGWSVAGYEGHALGWIKGLGNRVNNYFPKEWRILTREFKNEHVAKK